MDRQRSEGTGKLRLEMRTWDKPSITISFSLHTTHLQTSRMSLWEELQCIYRYSQIGRTELSFSRNLQAGRVVRRRRQWHPTPVLLPGKSHGRRSLEGCSPWGCKESDTTERLHFHFSLSCIGEGNGNPLQCSCLENPRDGGAWWAAVCEVAQGRTRLKQLSSSSSSGSWLTQAGWPFQGQVWGSLLRSPTDLTGSLGLCPKYSFGSGSRQSSSCWQKMVWMGLLKQQECTWTHAHLPYSTLQFSVAVEN